MSKYDVKIYIGKETYDKLEQIAKITNLSVSSLLGKVVREEAFISLVDEILKQCILIKNEVDNARSSLGSRH